MSFLHSVEKLLLNGSGPRKLLLLNVSSNSNVNTSRALQGSSFLRCDDAQQRTSSTSKHRYRDVKEYTIDEMPETNKIKKAKEFVDVMDGMRRTGNHRIVKEISVDESLLYMDSEAYKLTYGSKPVWVPYRRNHKGGFARRLTRIGCIREGVINTGSACPLCRDDYLVVHPRNLALLSQFLSPHTGELLPVGQTNVCQRSQLHLRIAIDRAQEQGALPYDVPWRGYDYALYYPGWGGPEADQ